MQYADQEGVFLHFKTLEQENDHLMNWDERRLYYRMLIAVYSHHLALNWNLAEEISIANNPDGTPEETLIRNTLQYIGDTDPYNHLRVFHTFGRDINKKYGWFLGETFQGKALLSGISLQTAIGSVPGDVQTWVENSAGSGVKWVVSNDEQGGAQTGVNSDDVTASRKQVRELVTWGTLMNGGAGTEFYYGYQTTFNGQSCSDLTCDNHRSRESKYLDAGIALQFFRDHLPYWQMAPMHTISDNSNDWVFAKAGEVYAVYLRDGGSTTITVSDSGPWRLDWFNPRTGVFVGNTIQFNSSSFNTGQPPNDTNQDWVALIRRAECGGPCPTSTPTPLPTATSTPDPSATATNTPPPGDAVVSFTLIDADSDQPVPAFDPIPDGATINLFDLGLQNISIRANTSPTQVGSVVFNLNGNDVQTENVAPYALAGDSNGNFNPWSYSTGSHILMATPYSGSNQSGSVGTPLSIIFQVLDTPPTATNTPSPGVTIWLENFSGLSDGTIKDNGDTKWSSSRARYPGSVQNGRFQLNNNGGEQIWMSEVINTSEAGTINISIQVDSQGTLETSGQNRDFIELYYRLDDGTETLFFNMAGNVSAQQVSVSGLSSDMVQFVIRAKTTGDDEYYYWDDIYVEAGQ